MGGEHGCLLERLLKGIRKRGSCWIWMGAKYRTGYGQIAETPGHPVSTHRTMWSLAFGAIPEHLFVLHTCDNRSCVRPSHLWLGTAQDNSTDMVRKNRQARGKAVGARLRPEDVRAIRRCHAGGMKGPRIARRFTTSNSNVCMIVNRKTWAWVE